FIARCCHVEYHTNSYVKGSKRYVSRQSFYNQKYIHFGGKCVLHVDILLRYVSDLLNMYAGFENFCGAYNDTVASVSSQNARDNVLDLKDAPLLERHLFENIWLIYSTALSKFFLSTDTEIEIPYHLSNRDERNHFFASQITQLERDFIQYWSNHMLKFNCGNQCCKAIVIDGFQKPDRYICNFMQELIHSEELGDIEWGCGFRPEMIPDKDNPGYWKNTKYCPKHIYLEHIQAAPCSIDKDDYNVVDCNVSRTDRYCGRRTSYGVILTMYNCGIILNFNELYRSESPTRVLHHLFTTIDCLSPSVPLPKYLIYVNACGLLLTFQNRFENGHIRHTARTDALNNMTFLVDKFHIGNHTRPMCQAQTNPYKYPDVNGINTVVCEQTNSKLKKYQNALSSFSFPQIVQNHDLPIIFVSHIFHLINQLINLYHAYKTADEFIQSDGARKARLVAQAATDRARNVSPTSKATSSPDTTSKPQLK
ncbi:unnamed protein product, partial [Adineta ricciae]